MRASPSVVIALATLVIPVIAAASSCSTTNEKPAGSERARDYYPLAVGNSWTYRITPAPPTQPEGEVVVVSEADGFFALNVGGKIALRGTSVTDGTRNLIEEPLAVGHQWIAVPAPSVVERYEIVATNAEVRVPAGTFRGCLQVRTEEEVTRKDGVKGKLVGVWSYAPGVGPIHFLQNVEMSRAPPQRNIEYTLVRYRLGGQS